MGRIAPRLGPVIRSARGRSVGRQGTQGGGTRMIADRRLAAAVVTVTAIFAMLVAAAPGALAANAFDRPLTATWIVPAASVGVGQTADSSLELSAAEALTGVSVTV